jgi:hypothetical protein
MSQPGIMRARTCVQRWKVDRETIAIVPDGSWGRNRCGEGGWGR